MPSHIKESKFEQDVVESLVTHGGYSQGRNEDFDLAACLDTAQLFTFVEETQPKEWSLLVSRYSGDQSLARTKLLARIVGVLETRGTLHALRKGVDDQGVQFKLAHFRPASGLNPTLVELYSKNRLTVTRQLRYSPAHANTLDLALFINGLLVATAELKSPLNGQMVDDAIKQYMKDRDPHDIVLGQRAVVHFALDPSLAYMTTALDFGKTEFLPFNRGNAPGKLSCGKGNPPNPDGYATAYLWEKVWSYDAWLDILGRFVESIEPSGKGATRRRVIFPRYHQWDAVTRLAEDARTKGPGEVYLIQHSAGSGKSNSIGWLAHRLSLLHNDADDKVFGKVIVVTDRRILDEQLRATVQQFENVPGTIVTIEGKSGSKSAELAEALTGKAQIVTVTLETFPYVIDKIAEADLAKESYAIVVDEAHSSQTGDASTALKQALGTKAAEVLKEHQKGEEIDAEVALAAIVAARGRQPNLSFFAFTATPKDRTVELFGTVDPTSGTKQPFHLYTMRQAIEEEFILDVLRNYVTYGTYYRLAAAGGAEGDEVDVRKAASEIKRFVARNPTMIAQKAAIIVEHYRAHTARSLGGRAKAMVVTDSRAAAVRYKRAIDRHIADHHYYDIKVLVAFSGTLTDDLDNEVSESMLNGFPESQTAKRFKGDDPFKPGDYQVLIVAEKFQTGFDEPYLHTMFVDKPLNGVNAVQTLSRLNRKAPGKDETFVLDFRNDAGEIGNAFQRYYEAVIIEPTDANVLYDLRARIWAVGILDPTEVAAASEAYFGIDPDKRSLSVIHANLDPAVVRFDAIDAVQQSEFKDAVDQFVRAYAFLSQVMPFTDPELERLYVYVKALRSLLRDPASGGLDLGDDLVLTHLRLEDAGAADITLEEGNVEPSKVFVGEGGGARADRLFDSLGAVIETINATFGADLDERDQLEVEKIKVSLLGNEDLKTFANANTEEHYALEFGPRFKGAVLDQEERNRRLYELLTSKPGLAKMIEDELMRETYVELRDAEGEATN